MKLEILKEWWDSILEKESILPKQQGGPLVNLRESERYFSLQPLAQQGFPNPVQLHFPSKAPAFKNLSPNDPADLRWCVYVGEKLPDVSLWAEKLMRYCEINHSILRKRALSKCGDSRSAQLEMLQVGAFLLDFYYFSGDARFLNTVLKLCDLNWVVNERSILRNLRSGGPELTPALFQVRLLLMSEHALCLLDSEGNP
jgi:hypothetical protein